jgi:hypothetical protein
LSYPYDYKPIKQIELKKGDITAVCQNVTAIMTSNKYFGIYYNDKEKGFIICYGEKTEEKIHSVKIDEEGRLYLLIETN